MASAKSVEEMLTSDVDESAVSALVGSLESQLASPTIHLTSQDLSSSHNHVNSISSTDNSFVSSGATNNRIGLAVPTTTTTAGGISSVTAHLAPSGLTTTPQQSSIPIVNCNPTTISAHAGNARSSSVSGSSSNSVTSNVKDGLTRIVTLSSNAPLNNSTNVSVTAANIIISNSNLVVVNAAPTSVITSTSTTNITSSATAAGNISAATTSSGIPPPTQQQTPAAFTVTLPGAIPASGYVNQFSTVTNAQTNAILQRTAIPNGNGPGSIAAALTASKVPSNVHGSAVITTISSTAPVMSVVSGVPKTGPQIRCALPSTANVNTIGMQNLTNVAVRQQQMIIPTTQHTSLSQQTQNIQGHSTPTVIAVAKSTASTAPPVNMVTQMVSNQQILQGVQLVNMNSVRPGTSPAQGQKTLAPRMVIGGPLRIAGGQQVLNARPGGPGSVQNAITLQPNVLRGTLFVKTENGQYQLLTAVGPGTTAGGVSGTGQTYRIQALPPGSHPQVRALTSQHGITMTLPGHPNQQIKMQQPMVHTVLQNPQQVGNIVSVGGGISHATAYTGNSVVSVQSPMGVSRAVTPSVVSASSVSASSASAAQSSSTPQMSPDTAKKKCKNFLSTLIRLASDQPEQVATNVKNLIQGLIDGNVPPEDFTNQLQRELNSSPQPCLIPFLKKSLPYLRHSLTTQELTIDGVRPPPLEVQGLTSTNLTVSTTTGPSVTPVSHLQITPTHISRPPLLSHGQVRLFTTHPSMVGTQPHLQHGDYTTVRIPQALGHRLAASSISQNQAHSIVPHASPVITPNRSTLTMSQTGMTGIQRAPIVRATAAKSTIISSLAKAASAPITISSPSTTLTAASSLTKDKEKRSFASMLKDDDDINDVAAMGGVNLVEESARILAQNAEFVGTQIRSCKDENFLFTLPLQRRIRAIAAKYGLDEPSPEVIAAVSHATQERLKDIVEKLGVVAEHRMEIVKSDGRHEVSQDVKGQLKFLEELDRVEKKRHEEQEREMLLRAAKSRSKLEDPEQLKLKQKAKEMQRAEMEEMRQREANMTALLAIGPRKKFKVDPNAYSSNNQQASVSGSSPSSGSSAFSSSRPQIIRPRVKRVNLRDLVFILEQERTSCRSLTLYKMLLK